VCGSTTRGNPATIGVRSPGELPDGVELALDLGVGIVVSSQHRGGRHVIGLRTRSSGLAAIRICRMACADLPRSVNS
jgi:hypothetical protein